MRNVHVTNLPTLEFSEDLLGSGTYNWNRWFAPTTSSLWGFQKYKYVSFNVFLRDL